MPDLRTIALGALLLIGLWEYGTFKWDRPKSLLLPIIDTISDFMHPPPKDVREWRVWCVKHKGGKLVQDEVTKKQTCDIP